MIFGKKNKTHPEPETQTQTQQYPIIEITDADALAYQPRAPTNQDYCDYTVPQWLKNDTHHQVVPYCQQVVATVPPQQQSSWAHKDYYYEASPAGAATVDDAVVITQPTVTGECTQPTAAAAANNTNKPGKKYLPIRSRSPVMMACCPHCQKQNVATKTKSRFTGVTYASMVGGALVFLPLAVVPAFVGPLKQTNHHCTSCGTKVGRVKTLRFTQT